MNKLFNTDFEFSLRILLLLSCFEDFLSKYMIRDLDLLATYGKNFNISKINLHGNKSCIVSELHARHALVEKALKELVKMSLVTINITGEGFKYKISNEGQRYCNCLSSDYSKNYKKEMEKVKTYVNSKSENEIHQFIYKQGLGE